MAGHTGNLNALKHGGRIGGKPNRERYGMVLSGLGQKYVTAYLQVKKFRSCLEAHAESRHGSIPLETIALIDAAARWEMTAKVAQWQLRLHEDLSATETVSILNTVTHATRQRNAIISKLGLDGSDPGDGTAGVNPWDALGDPPESPETPQVAQQSDPTAEDLPMASSTTDAKSGDGGQNS